MGNLYIRGYKMKKIPLTKGKFAFVDDEDFETLHQYNWCMQGDYAARWKSRRAGEQGGSQVFYMHRVIMGIGDRSGDKREVDHINGNKLDNRKDNLRICSHAQNAANKVQRNRFGYKGVVKFNGKKYQSMIWDGKKNLHIGLFETIEAAARAYDKAAKELQGEFASLNFPEK